MLGKGTIEEKLKPTVTQMTKKELCFRRTSGHRRHVNKQARLCSRKTIYEHSLLALRPRFANIYM